MKKGALGVSEEDQRAYAQAGKTTAHPNVESTEKTRPTTVHMLAADEVKEFNKYEKLWKEVCQHRIDSTLAGETWIPVCTGMTTDYPIPFDEVSCRVRLSSTDKTILSGHFDAD
jgi:hypothetical protein